MTWNDMELAIETMLVREWQWRMMLSVTLAQASGLWLVVAMLERRAYRIKYGLRPTASYAWLNYAVAVALLIFATTLWRS